jgi:RNA polymerase sigma-70 factor (ECF subfamily)
METPSVTSLTLVDRLKFRDAEGWKRFVQLYGPLIYQWCQRARLRSEDAADVAQEVFQAVALQVANFRKERPADSFRGWLWTITRNKIGDHFRRRARSPSAPGGSDAHRLLLDLPEQLPPDESSASEEHDLIHRALDLVRPEFEERTWQMFWRVAVEGHAPRDIAAELGVTPDAVRMAKSRVLRRLREELGDFAGE